MNIKQKVKNTLLINENIKEKILSIKWKLPYKLEYFLDSFFLKYWKIEKKIISDLDKNMTNIYLKTIRDIEKQERIKNKKEIENMLNF